MKLSAGSAAHKIFSSVQMCKKKQRRQGLQVADYTKEQLDCINRDDFEDNLVEVQSIYSQIMVKVIRVFQFGMCQFSGTQTL